MTDATRSENFVIAKTEEVNYHLEITRADLAKHLAGDTGNVDQFSDISDPDLAEAFSAAWDEGGELQWKLEEDMERHGDVAGSFVTLLPGTDGAAEGLLHSANVAKRALRGYLSDEVDLSDLADALDTLERATGK